MKNAQKYLKWNNSYLLLLISIFVTSFNVHAGDALSYTGRLANANGSPVTGPVDLVVDLAYTDPITDVGPVICSKTMLAVPLANGVFHLKIDYTLGQCGGKSIPQVLSEAPVNETAAIRITDTSHTKAYPFQAIHTLPYAGVSTLAKNLVKMGATNGQVLKFNGTTWAPASGGGAGSVTQVDSGAGLTGGPITATGTLAVNPDNTSIEINGASKVAIKDGGVTAAKINQMAAGPGNVLKWNGTAWAPAVDNGLTSETDPTVQGYAKNLIPVCTNDKMLKFDALLNLGAGGLFCQAVTVTTDVVAEGATNKYFSTALAKSAAVADAINNGTTDIAPSQNAVFDALALKQNLLGNTSDIEVRQLGIGTPTPGAKLGVTSALSGAAGIEYGMKLNTTVTQTGTAGYTGILMDVTDSASTGSGAKKLMDLKVNGVTVFAINSLGAVTSTVGSSGTSADYTSSGGQQLTVGYDATNKTVMNVGSDGKTTFTAAGTAPAFNFAGGSVGVGVASPAEALDVNGSIKASTSVKTPILSNVTDLTFISDSDNNASGALIFNTGTNERIRVLNDGKVGIGTVLPTAKLDVNGVIQSSTGANAGEFRIGGSAVLSASSTTLLNINAGNFTDVSINGKVGIGTSLPGALLDVGSRFKSGDNLALGSGGGYANTMETVGPGNVNGLAIKSSNALFDGYDASNNLIYRMLPASFLMPGIELYGYTQNKFFQTAGLGTLRGQTGLRLETLAGSNGHISLMPDGTGKVGIGTTTPTAALEIKGTVDQVQLAVKSNATQGNYNAVFYNQSAAAVLGISAGGEIMRPAGVVGDLVLSNLGPNSVTLNTNGSEKMRVTSAGNVGIGTTAPGGLLHITGSTSVLYPRIEATANGQNSELGFIGKTSGGVAQLWDIGLNIGTTQGEFQIYDRTAGLARVHITTATGNLGIGNTNPAEKLDVTGNIALTGKARFKSDNANYVELNAPTALAGTIAFTLPGTIGAAGNVLSVNGAGIMSWIAPPSGAPSGAAGGDLSGTYPNPAITALAATKISDGSIDNTEFGYLNNVTSNIQTQLNAKEPLLATGGTTLQYFRGDKTLATLNTTVVPEGTNLYFLDSRVRAALMSGYAVGTAVPVAVTDTLIEALGKLEAQIIANDTAFDNSGQWTKSGSVVYYNGGNVGVGTAVPETPLHVVKNGAANNSVDDIFTLERKFPSAANGAGQRLVFKDLVRTTGAAEVQGEIASIKVDKTLNAALTNSQMTFALKDQTTSALNNIMTLDYSGNVGIGTTSPAYSLEVNSTVVANGIYSRFKGTAGGIQFSSNNNRGSIEFLNNTNTSAGSLFHTTGGWRWDNNFNISSGSSIGSTYVSTAPPTNGLIVEGNVGIGNTLPGEKLDVTGNIALTGKARFKSDNANYVEIKAPTALAGTLTFTLPGTIGAAGNVLSVNGAGIMSWIAPPSGAPSGAAGGDLSGTYPNPTITALAATKISDGSIDNTEFGYLNNVTSNIQTQLNAKEPLLATGGTTLQYFRGDKTLATLNTTVVPEGTNLYFLDSRVRAALMSGYAVGTAVPVAVTDTLIEALGKLEAQIIANDTAFDNSGQWTKSGSIVYYNGGKVGIGTAAPGYLLELSGTATIADRTIGINGVPMVYLPVQGVAVGQLDGSMAIGNGLRSAQNTATSQGRFNTAVGLDALFSNTTGETNTAIGSRSLKTNTTGTANTATGFMALFANTAGWQNTAMGTSALASNSTGISNTAFGYGALNSNTSGQNNVAIGDSALRLQLIGSANVAVGQGSLYSITGSGNTALGFAAGQLIADGVTPNITSSTSVYVGGLAYPLADGGSNEIVIGYSATGNGSNSVTLGNDSITKSILKGSVGIGNTSPGEKLDVTGNIALTGKARFKSDNANYVEIKAPAALAGTLTFTLPGVIGAAGNVLSVNGAGIMSWIAPPGGAPTGAAGGDLSGTYPNPTITALAATKISDGSIDNTEFGYLNNVTSNIQTQLNAKEPLLATGGTTLQYFRGDKTLATLNTTVVPEGTNLYFLDSRVRAALMSGYAVGTAIPLATTDTLIQALGKLEAQIIANDTAFDNSGQWSQSGSFVYYNGGNVGVGTAAPTGKLDVAVTATEGFRVKIDSSRPVSELYSAINNNATTIDNRMSTSNSGTITNNRSHETRYFWTSTGGTAGYRAEISAYLDATGASDTNMQASLHFKTADVGDTAANDRMTILGNGNVGIGTTNPVSKLHVHKNITNDVVSPLGLFGYSGNAINRSIIFEQIGNISTASQYIFLNGHLGPGSVTGTPVLSSAFAPTFGFESNDTNLSIVTAAAGTNVATIRALSVLSSGNVGISNTSPGEKLDVTGNIALTGKARFKSDNANYVELNAPAALAGTLSFTLPGTIGASGNILSVNGSGVMSWIAPPGGAPTGAAGGDLSGTYPNPTISALAATKIGGGAIDNTEFSYLNNVTSNIQTQLNAKEASLATGGTTAQYFRGDKSLATLNTTAVPEGTGLYFLDSRVRGALMSGYTVGSALPVAATDTLVEALGKIEAQIIASGTGHWTKTGSIVNYNGGNVGIGTSTPQAELDINGSARLAKYAAQPFACTAAKDGTISLTSVYTTCVCKGGSTAWVKTTDGVTACSWNTPAPCSTTTISNCDLAGTVSGSSAGACASGYTGSCSYLCTAGTFGLTTNTCTNVVCPTGHASCNGSTGALAGTSCNQLKTNGVSSSGIYYIKPGAGAAFQTYCDMTTDGGGWTLLTWNGNIASATTGIPFPGYNVCSGLNCERGTSCPTTAACQSLINGSTSFAIGMQTSTKTTYGTIASYTNSGKYVYSNLSSIVLPTASVVCSTTGALTGTYTDITGTSGASGTTVYLSTNLAYSTMDPSTSTGYWNVGFGTDACSGSGTVPGSWTLIIGSTQYGPISAMSTGAKSIWVK